MHRTYLLAIRVSKSVALAILFSLSAAHTHAEGQHSKQVGVVELFTSQGCYSCPPADENLAQMLEAHPDILALEFHVDYWNDLVWGSDGTWEDPFSDPEYTLRQYQYNKAALKGRQGVYTPQSVINGQYAAVGINKSLTRDLLDRSVPNDVSVVINAVDDQLTISIDNPDSLKGANIYFARYLKKTSTAIKGGENNGKQLHNVNVVTSYEPLGKLTGDSLTSFSVASNNDTNSGCAVVVQSDKLGPILGAAICP